MRYAYDYCKLSKRIAWSSGASDYGDQWKDHRVHHGAVGRCLRDRPSRAARRGASLPAPMGGARYADLNAEQKAKAIARGKLNLAVYHGRVKRQPCEVCGATPAQAHHADYSKPLDVEWLCPTHHREADAVKRRREEAAMYQSEPSPLVQRYRDEVIAERDLEPTGVEYVDQGVIERYREEARFSRVSEGLIERTIRSEIEQALDAVGA